MWKLPQLFAPITRRHIEQQVLYNTNIHKLFRIIQDVDQYSNFLPLCSYSKIIPSSKRNGNDGRHYFEATLTVGVPPFLQETYDSAVYINHDQYTVETQSIKSQKFDSLKSFWKLSSPASTPTTTSSTTQFLKENIPPNIPNDMHLQSIYHPQKQQHPLSTTTTTTELESTNITNVYFMVEMTVSDPMIATTLDQLLVKVAKQQVEAFAQRCQTI
jgi:ribosome-associated toxin RatA of RatAB toxin-antitoxin module